MKILSAPEGIRTLTSEDTGLSNQRGCQLRHQRVHVLGFEPRPVSILSRLPLPLG